MQNPRRSSGKGDSAFISWATGLNDSISIWSWNKMLGSISIGNPEHGANNYSVKYITTS